MSELNNPSAPQFDSAEFTATADGVCPACHAPLGAGFYRVNGVEICASCAAPPLAVAQSSASHATFVKALTFGAIAAILGLVLYAGFTIITGYYIGVMALAVGWIVAKAMMLGSKGAGGRKYQIAAVLLTYFSISVAFVPIAIDSSIKQDREAAEQKTVAAPTTNNAQAPDASAPPSDSAQSAADNANAASAAEPEKKNPSLLSAAGEMTKLGLLSPFLAFQYENAGSAAIGLFILFIGLRIAWQKTAGTVAQIEGPF